MPGVSLSSRALANSGNLFRYALVLQSQWIDANKSAKEICSSAFEQIEYSIKIVTNQRTQKCPSRVKVPVFVTKYSATATSFPDSLP